MLSRRLYDLLPPKKSADEKRTAALTYCERQQQNDLGIGRLMSRVLLLFFVWKRQPCLTTRTPLPLLPPPPGDAIFLDWKKWQHVVLYGIPRIRVDF
jgi:hypothetical protein